MRRAAGRTPTALAAAFLLAAAIVATSAAPAAATGPSALRLTVAFTGDVSGYLEPCG